MEAALGLGPSGEILESSSLSSDTLIPVPLVAERVLCLLSSID